MNYKLWMIISKCFSSIISKSVSYIFVIFLYLHYKPLEGRTDTLSLYPFHSLCSVLHVVDG